MEATKPLASLALRSQEEGDTESKRGEAESEIRQLPHSFLLISLDFPNGPRRDSITCQLPLITIIAKSTQEK